MGWTCTGVSGAAQLRQALMRAPSPIEACQLLDEQIQALTAAVPA